MPKWMILLNYCSLVPAFWYDEKESGFMLLAIPGRFHLLDMFGLFFIIHDVDMVTSKDGRN